MTDGEHKSTVGEKTLRVSLPLHEKFVDFKHENRCRNADQALGLLLADNVVHVPVPAMALARWRATADASGFPLDQWVAQLVEGYLATRADAGEIRRALDELITLRRAQTGEPFTPCEICTTPKSCKVGGQKPGECR